MSLAKINCHWFYSFNDFINKHLLVFYMNIRAMALERDCLPCNPSFAVHSVLEDYRTLFPNFLFFDRGTKSPTSESTRLLFHNINSVKMHVNCLNQCLAQTKHLGNNIIVTYVGNCARYRGPRMTRTHYLFSTNSKLLERKTCKQSHIHTERILSAFQEFITKAFFITQYSFNSTPIKTPTLRVRS